MLPPDAPLVFDGHNDVLYHLSKTDRATAVRAFREGRRGDAKGHIDLPRARAGGFGGGFFAIWSPSPDEADHAAEMVKPSYDLPLPAPLDQASALSDVVKKAALLRAMDTAGAVALCRSTTEIRAAFAVGQVAAVMHLEGAEAIDADLAALDILHAAGLRSLGPVWSRPTIFGHGVPFRYPSTGDIGAGLTEAGERLVKRCNALGIMIDLSHLNEAGFWDVARLSDAPLVATHSNVHAICPHARNLTDRQLDAIAASGGVVGLNFAAAFLRADGQMDADIPLDTMLTHLDHLIARVGEDGVALGSDFDGATVPEAIGDVAGLPKFFAAMRAHGYGEELMRKLAHENWLRVLEITWGARAVSGDNAPTNPNINRELQ